MQCLRGAGRVGDLEAAEAELAAGVGGFGDWVREGATLRGKREEVVIPGSDGGESGSEMSDMSNDHRQKRGEGHKWPKCAREKRSKKLTYFSPRFNACFGASSS